PLVPIVTEAAGGLDAGVLTLDEEISTVRGSAAPVPEASPRLFVQFSSGTTGLRKGVVVDRAMLESQLAGYGAAIGLGRQDRIVSWLPLYHDMGLVACFLLPLAAGAASITISPFAWLAAPAEILTLIARYRGTLVWLPNFAYSLLVERVRDEDVRPGTSLRSVRAVINCSEPVRAEAHERFLRRFGALGLEPATLQACYAMAENVFAVTQTPLGSPVRVDTVRRDAFVASHRAVPVSTAAEGVGGAPAESGTNHVLRFVSCGVACADTEVRIAEGRRHRDVGEI